MSNKAFVELKFSNSTIKIFNTFLNEIIPENMFYYSPVAEHIRGNMAKTLHCTVLFGLNENAKSDLELQNIIQENSIPEIELGELWYINGFENLYKVLVINILDKQGSLKSLHNKIKDFALKQNPNFKDREFLPHLTLAYVKNEYLLEKNTSKLPNKINVLDIKVSLVSEFNRAVNL